MSALCSGGRDSIAPEELLRALLLEAFYGVRSERQSMEQVTDDMPFRSFIGLSTNAPVWDMTVFTKNRSACRRQHRGRVPPGGHGRPGGQAASVPMGSSRSTAR